MQYRQLGRTGLQVSRVSLGTGGPSRLGQTRGKPEAESHRVIHRALDLGINLFDTSPVYSDSEAILGRALEQAAGSTPVYICTKIYPYRKKPWDDAEGKTMIEPEEAVQSVERSLQRLQVDTLDILLLHGVRPPSYAAVIDTLYPALVRLREQGKLRFIGVSETDTVDARQATISRAVEDDLFDVIMLRYNVVSQGPERRVFVRFNQDAPGVMGMSPVRPPFCRPEALTAFLQKLKAAGKLSQAALSPEDPLGGWIEEGPAALAANGIRFVARNPAVHTIVTGTAEIDHLEANVRAALGPPLPEAVQTKLEELYGEVSEPLKR